MSLRKLETAEMHRLPAELAHDATRTPVVLVLDNIRSALNVGSLFRTADAFLLESLVLCGITATPPHREILKTALGATQSVPWQYAADSVQAVSALQGAGYAVWAVEQTTESTPLQRFKPGPHQPLALVLGNEVTGVSDAVLSLCTGAIEIPQLGSKHSLNVAVCGGIVAWHCYHKLRANALG
jgi:tRNA G18 (ribose-2'-O)-methylase SpoU